jgi:hypothetical protein
MKRPLRIAAASCAHAALLVSLSAAAQTGQPQPQTAQPQQPQVAQPAAVAVPQPPPRAPMAAAPAFVYPTVQPQPAPGAAPMPGQPYQAYDPSTGQLVLVSPFIQAARQPPKELPYVENRPIPAGYSIDEYHLRGLIIGGAVTLGTLWAISFSVASSNDFSGANGWLAVPVIGPFGWLATRKTPKCDGYDSYYDTCHNDESSNRTLVAFDGIGQVAGAAMLVAGLAITRKRLVLVDPQAAIGVAPYASSRGSGLQIVGQF